MNRPSEIMWVHVIRLLSIVAVVWVHSTAEIFFYDAPFGSYNWWVADIYDSLVRICVPLLFMISGYLLLGKSEPAMIFLKKRAMKVVVPLLAWSAIYLLWINFREYAHPSHASSMTPDWLQKIHDAGWLALLEMLWTPMYYHLWFLYALLGLYLVTPLLRVLVQNIDRRLLWYFILLSFIATTLLPMMETVTSTDSMIQLNMVRGDILYFVLGYMLGNMAIPKNTVPLMAVVAPVCGAITIAGIYYLTAASHGELQQEMWWPAKPNVIGMSIAAFILLRHWVEKCDRLNAGKTAEVLVQLSAASFGVYLIHPLFLYAFGEGLFGFTLTSVSGNPVIFVPIVVLATFAASYVVIRIIQKIPVLRQIVP